MMEILYVTQDDEFVVEKKLKEGHLWNSFYYMILDTSTLEHVYTVDNLLKVLPLAFNHELLQSNG